jgi:DNA-binding XRE family transcriptional regulator
MKHSELAGSIREARKVLGLTQAEMAGQLGVSRMTIIRWEQGETKPQRWWLPLIDAPTPTPAGGQEQ